MVKFRSARRLKLKYPISTSHDEVSKKTESYRVRVTTGRKCIDIEDSTTNELSANPQSQWTIVAPREYMAIHHDEGCFIDQSCIERPDIDISSSYYP